MTRVYRQNAGVTVAARSFDVHCGILVKFTAVVLLFSVLSSLANADKTDSTDTDEPVRANTGSEVIEEVSVTASRIVRNGYSAPTPVKIVGDSDLRALGQPTVFQAIFDLPVMAGSRASTNYSTGQSFGYIGVNTVNLRGLGLERTLVLVDGQRMSPAWITGVANAAAIPEALTERVEIVTGGASASWGSDAVAGVVNYVLDNDFSGIKGNVFGGATDYGDDGQFGATAAFGRSLFDGRGHIVASGEIYRRDGIPKGVGGRDWYNRTRILQRSISETPEGEPQLLVAPNVVGFNLAPGGIITSGPLRGTAFGPGGTPHQFDYGSLTGGVFMSGGEQSSDMGENANLAGKLDRTAFYSRLSYDATPSTTLFATVMLSAVRSGAHSFQGQFRPAALTIQCDNAFLPSEVVDGCAANGIDTFQFGTFTQDFPDGVTYQKRDMRRFVVGANGEFLAFERPWTWDAYAAHGRSFAHIEVQNTSLKNLFELAIDSVVAPDGAIVCRSTLTDPGNGCVPFNVIGTGVASQAALDWVLGTPYLDSWIDQTVVSLSANGEPFSLWAGPVSIAAGYEYREESFEQVADDFSEGQGENPLLNPAGNNWFIGNYHASHGNYHLNEVFLEAAIPLTDSDRFGHMELSLAGRVTDYTTSGTVSTWKTGITYDPSFAEGLRLRALRSLDIRAPNLIEGFAAPQSASVFANDTLPPYADQQFSVQVLTAGNSSLDPETSMTTQYGVVLQPSWLPGVGASVDYWRISVEDAIGTISLQQVFDLCALGNQVLCDRIERDALGQPVVVRQSPINLAKLDAEGVDIELSYTTDVADVFAGMSGQLTLRAMGTHYRKMLRDPGIPNAIVVDDAGSSAISANSVPSWKWLFTQTYRHNRLRLSLTEEYVSSGKINNNYIECTSGCPRPTVNNPTINDNNVASALYLGLGGSYDLQQIGGSPVDAEVYFKIDNLLDRDPPLNPHLAAGVTGYIYRPANHFLHDTLGRRYRLGVRFNF